jgi:lipopolysaccharide/colanic/teichoic acid biosynthesis glycosyltransferase
MAQRHRGADRFLGGSMNRPREEASAAVGLRLAPEVPARVADPRLMLRERLRILLDQLMALCLLVAAGPFMLTLAWLVRQDGGPAIFAHYRVGRGGRLFRCIKFRTMRTDAEHLLSQLLDASPMLRTEWLRDQKLANDPRVTSIGRWLRRTSLDELPQLLNVLRGEMALVGPRPITGLELRRYGPARWQYLSVVPGITGLWQVSGRSAASYETRVELDELYVRTRTPWLDMKILAKTVVVVLTRDGAC